MGLAKKLGIAVLLYVILGIVWTLVKIWVYGVYIYIHANDTIYRVFDLLFLPITLLVIFVLPPPPVTY